MSQWISEMELLSHIAKVEPQAAYCCFTTGFKHNVTYLMRTTPNINEVLRRLDDAINDKQYHPSQKTSFAEMMNDIYYHYQLNLGEWV